VGVNWYNRGVYQFVQSSPEATLLRRTDGRGDRSRGDAAAAVPRVSR